MTSPIGSLNSVYPWNPASLCVPAGQGYLAFMATHGLPYVTDIALENVAMGMSPCNETTSLVTGK